MQIVIIRPGMCTPKNGRIEAVVDHETGAEVGTAEADALVSKYGNLAVSGSGSYEPGDEVTVDGEGVIVDEASRAIALGAVNALEHYAPGGYEVPGVKLEQDWVAGITRIRFADGSAVDVSVYGIVRVTP